MQYRKSKRKIRKNVFFEEGKQEVKDGDGNGIILQLPLHRISKYSASSIQGWVCFVAL
jgi:hypothetical protein